MAIIYLYRPLKTGDTFTSNKVAITKTAYNIEFIENNSDVGSFSFCLPGKDRLVPLLQEKYLIGIDNEYFGIIRRFGEVNSQSSEIIVSGDDLKGYTKQRITLYPSTAIAEGLQGYDAINNSSTEEVVKYFVNNNMINPTNTKRKIPKLVLSPNLSRGIKNDKYMSRFELLNEVCKKNCDNAKLGYRISPNFTTSELVFDVYEGTDHTAKQAANKRVVFDLKRKNITSEEYNKTSEVYKNIFYASKNGSQALAETPTYMYYRDNEGETEGTDRDEQHLNISVDIEGDDTYELMKEYALKDATEYVKTETYIINCNNKYKYGVDFKLGDYVSLQPRLNLFSHHPQIIDVQITSVKHTWRNGTEINHELTFGDGIVTIFDLLKRQIKNGGI